MPSISFLTCKTGAVTAALHRGHTTMQTNTGAWRMPGPQETLHRVTPRASAGLLSPEGQTRG